MMVVIMKGCCQDGGHYGQGVVKMVVIVDRMLS